MGGPRGQLVFATAPFVGAVVAWTVFGEFLTRWQLASLLIAAVGVSFVLDSAHVHEHRHEPLEHEHEHTHDDGHHDHEHPAWAGGREVVAGTRHTHRHVHRELVHSHPHVPDLHHRHDHG